MHIDKALRALRGDDPAQRQAQEAMERVTLAWRQCEATQRIEQELARFGKGSDWEDCDELVSLIDNHLVASDLVERLFGRLTEVLEQFPFAHVPLRHQYAGGTAMLQLAQAGPAALVLLAYDECAAIARPESVSFSDVERHEIVLAGAADLRIAELVREEGNRGAIDSEPRRIVAGEAMHFGANTTRICERIHGRMVVLRVARSPLLPQPSRAFKLDDGLLLQRASGDRTESQREMAMVVLGRMGRDDAAPLLAELVFEGSEHFRWQALRECLALDSSVGFATLERLAAKTEDPLAAQAGLLRARLIEMHPQLATIREIEECHV